MKPNINRLSPYVAGKSSQEISLKYGLENVVKLGSNENPLGVSPLAKQAMFDALNDISTYPDGSSLELVTALSKYHNLPENYFIPGNGSDEILLMICAAFLNAGDKVLISENTFSQYECCSTIFDAQIQKIPLKNYTYDIQGYLKALSADVKMCFLCNPNNPTGTFFPHDELVDLLKGAPDDCIIVVDEAYGDYVTDKTYPVFKELVKDYPNLIVCKTFSKIFGLAGVRLGFAVANPNSIIALAKVKNFNPFNVNKIAQAGGVAALNDSEFIKKSITLVSEGKAFLQKEFSKRNIQFLPTQANYLCFQTHLPSVDLDLELEKQGVIIRGLKNFSMPDWYRLTVGTLSQNKTFLTALDKIKG